MISSIISNSENQINIFPQLKDFFEKCSQELTNLANKDETPKNTLHHYTNKAGFEGIIKSKNLHMTDYRYLNDPLEIGYSLNSISKLIDKTTQEKNHDSVTENFWMGFNKIFIDTFKNEFNTYVLSFCLTPGHMNAWHLYGDNGFGFSIGFRKDYFAPNDIKIENIKRLIGCAKVHYDSTDFKNYISKLIEMTNIEIYTAQTNGYLNDNFIKDLGTILSVHIIPLLAKIKHPDFSNELEHRLFEMEYSREEMRQQFGFGVPVEKRNIRPRFINSTKIDVPIAITENFNYEDIYEIWIGPRLNYEKAKNEIRKLLRENGYPNAETIPIYQSRVRWYRTKCLLLSVRNFLKLQRS